MEQAVQKHVAAPVTEIEEIFTQEEVLPLEDNRRSTGFNVNKLQAVLCILASSLISIGVIAWLIAG
ncbi:hypothetical protein Q8A64_05625 [Oxalobacteraceae bacterium R-40]|uniref:Uncharacterized protein n=1 Tax=Keguizhuia sedimenti TaxID=3064264 RepID=A0ABU1BLN2_9BURK|nr:hypothetical protein [Oxalobacteraceae bacterium R-40]